MRVRQLAVALCLVGLAGCASSQSLLRGTPFGADAEVDFAAMSWDKRGFYWRDLQVGEGREPNSRSSVSVEYIVRLSDGSLVDRSSEGEPLSLRLGEGVGVRGLEFGLRGMKEGGVRQLVVPPSLAYGEQGNARVPPRAVLVMIVRLHRVR